VSPVPPIRREILVDAQPDAAFEVFTAGLGQWWPVDEKSVHGKGATVAFDDGQIVEHSADGEPVVWGTVIRWEPPAAVAFTWHPGHPAERASQVVVTFAAEGTQTLVRLEHSGWESFADPAAARAEYVAFLNRMREDGYLVLAGPLGDAAGEGMTILRLPGPGRLGEATRLATEDDASVAGGFLAVTVRPWQVMMVAG
jgi:uncharacterized protein YndB with AHSA1/START domain